MNQNQLNDAAEPRSVDQQQACSAFVWVACPWCDGDRGMQIRTSAQWTEGNFATLAVLTMLPNDEWELNTSRGTLTTRTDPGPDHIKQAKAWAEGHLCNWPNA